jgi:SM-20-related protein
MAELRKYALAREADFRPGEVTPRNKTRPTSHPSYRRALVLHDLGKFEEIVTSRVKSYLPWVLDRLAIPAFTPSRIQIEMAAMNHGGFFRRHVDFSTGDKQQRALSFAFYFHREPRRFTGGELRLYRTWFEDGQHLFDDTFRVVKPLHNQIVFFPSYTAHEVRPVKCATRLHADSRFTLNGHIEK